MDKVIDLFTDGALRAEKAGFDIIELQMGHGYLAAQFLSPAVNNREDAYGGNEENRSRFPLAILDAIIKEVYLPIIARVSGDEMIPNGFHVEEMIRFVRELKNRGVQDRKSTRLNSSHIPLPRMPSSA